MAAREVRIERLLNRRVRDRDGRAVGPIEELVVELRDGVVVVVEYRVGSYVLLERLAGSSMRQALLGLFGRGGGPWAVPWDRMDLTNPARPRLTCAVAELRKAAR